MRQGKTRELTAAAMMTALMAILSQVQLSIGPVPFNLAVLGAYLTGLLLPVPYAAGSVAAYIVLGGFGVPVFAGFSGGPAVLFGPTGGYIFGYLFTAVLTALGARGGMHPVRTGVRMAAGLAVCYALGTAWFMAVMPYTLAQSLAACVTPFVVPDIVKGVAAYSFCKVLSARMAKAGL